MLIRLLCERRGQSVEVIAGPCNRKLRARECCSAKARRQFDAPMLPDLTEAYIPFSMISPPIRHVRHRSRFNKLRQRVWMRAAYACNPRVMKENAAERE